MRRKATPKTGFRHPSSNNAILQRFLIKVLKGKWKPSKWEKLTRELHSRCNYSGIDDEHLQNTIWLRTQVTSRSTCRQPLQCDDQPSCAKHKKSAHANDIQEHLETALTMRLPAVTCKTQENCGRKRHPGTKRNRRDWKSCKSNAPATQNANWRI